MGTYYILPEEVFRLGNTTSPKLSHVRSRDVDIVDRNGIKVIIANGKGISVFDRIGIKESPMSGWVWRFAANTKPPHGLKLIKDKAHHYCIAPMTEMPVSKYKGLLEELALWAAKVYKKEGAEI